MIRKTRKVVRYWSSRLRSSSCVPLYWHIGTPNFGDDINPSFFEQLTGVRLRLETRRKTPHFFGVGSILNRATETSITLGCGLLEPVSEPPRPRVVSLRGELSRRTLGIDSDIPLGDPLVLIDRLVKPKGGDAVGFIPHVRSASALRKYVPDDMRFIDPGRPPWQVVQAIGECSMVLSQSLHGLIVADALAIPNLWLAPSAHMKGGSFKFEDYFSTLDAPKTSHAITPELLNDVPWHAFSVGRYKGNKSEYHDVLRAAIREGIHP